MKKFIPLFVILVLFGCVGESDIELAEEEQAEYCGNVYIYKMSDGLAGWPDYNGNYEENCAPRAPQGIRVH